MSVFDLVAVPDNRENGNYPSMSHNVRRKIIELVMGSDLTSKFFSPFIYCFQNKHVQ